MIELHSAGFDDRDPYYRKPLSSTTTHALALIISGQLSYRIDGQTLRLKKGDLIFIPVGSKREGYHELEDFHQKYWATFVSSKELESFPLLKQHTPYFVHTRRYEYMKQRFSMLVQQWMGKLPYYESICSAIMTEMIGQSNRELDERYHPSTKLDLITNIQNYILSHYRETIRVDQLADLMGRSPNYISHLFRQLTGNTVKEYVHLIKISAARDLILNKGISICEAAEYVGFCDQSYFNRVFKKLYGFPPSALLKEKENRNVLRIHHTHMDIDH